MAKTIQKQACGIGILGGTFDPIHLGHTESARSVAQQLNLSRVLFIPAYIPPHKSCDKTSPRASAQQRATMVELTCAQEDIFQCDQRELNRQGQSYTLDTLTELKQCYPKQTLYFIMGMDSLLTFSLWHKYQDILRLCHLVVNTRPRHALSTLNQTTKDLVLTHQITDLKQLKNQKFGGVFFTEPMSFDISSTQIRHNLKHKLTCQSLLSGSIIDFINKNKLYR